MNESMPGMTEIRLARFLSEVATEVERARRLFPDTEALGLAMIEEVGELAKAYLSESRTSIRVEAVQAAAMIARIALDGEPSGERYRRARKVEDHDSSND